MDAGGRTLVETLATAHAPRIEVTSPRGGETWFAGDQTLRWTASDEDGDALTYFVDVSPDGGEPRLPVAVDLAETEYSFGTSSVEVGTAHLGRVRTSDGVNTTGEVPDGIFTVQGKRALPAGCLLIGGQALLGLVGVALVLWGLFFRRSRKA
ncbi:MAG TPA: hypothetical protein VLD63_14285 [Anaerolineales bacterium]|nr:hypothetical protein [Anaerolineales bacterium]